MKITNLKIIMLRLPSDSWMVIKIDTDSGISGWGEITGSSNDDGLALILSQQRSFLIGKNPLNIKECLSMLTQWTYPNLLLNKVYSTALSGIDRKRQTHHSI